MGKRLNFNVELVVSDDVDESRAAEVLQAILSDLENDDSYHEVIVLDDIQYQDETAKRMLDILSTIDEDDVEKAIESVEKMEDNNE